MLNSQGTVVGPKTSDGIKAVFGDANVATEGIEYAALLGTNVILGGTDHKSKQLMANMLKTMHAKCPDSVIVAGGYSQGAAVSHRAIESLSPEVKAQIAGVILYGDTQRTQDLGRIRGFDRSKTKIICAEGDLVCWGTLLVLPPHLTYGDNAEEGAAFLNGKIKAALEAKSKKAQASSAKEMNKLVKKSIVGVASRWRSS